MYKRLSDLISKNIPTFFYTNFKGDECHCYTLDELESADIEFAFNSSASPLNHPHQPIFTPITYQQYKKKFDQVMDNLQKGNTYLLNLTQPTPIQTNLSLKQIYDCANAPFKVRVEDKFVCFSPEPFIEVEGNTIHTFPMKGTIDASIPNAIELIMNDEKEIAEHTMIVDLLRNDLGIVAKDIRVEKFRYITTIDTGNKKLHQVSSHIIGTLDKNWKEHIGELLRKILPAGSISGTPKKKTVELIEEIEEYSRGYFTGVCGYFDGKKLQSGVMIRFIEKENGKLYYKSGGGITSDSDPQKEYQEMIDKIYIP